MRPTRAVSGMKHALRVALRPKVILPVVLGIALLAALLAFAGVQQALQLITHFKVVYLIYFFLLMAGYEVVRCWQWHYMLDKLNIQVPVRTQVFSYAIGEFTKNLPIGNFVPDYVLTRSKGTDFGLASSATLLISVLEVAISLAGIVMIGIDGWQWIRPVILIGTFLFALLAWAFYRWHHAPHPADTPHGHAPTWARKPLGWKWVQNAMGELRQFVQGEATLLHPQVLAVCSLACAAYLVLAGLALYVVILGLGLSGITWYEALSASFFSLAVSTIIPLPVDLGSTEVSGASALYAMGLSAAGAVSALLLYRFLNLVTQIFVAALASIALPDEFRAMIHAGTNQSAPRTVEATGT